MAEHLRNALRDFALQKMRDLEAERTTKSKKDEDSASKSRKPTKIKINRDISKAISGPSKNPDKPQPVTSDSKKSTKRHHEESTSGDKITKLMKLYQEDATAVISAAGKEGSVSVKSYSEESECKRTTDPSMDEHSVQEQGGKKTVKHSGWKVVKEEPPTAKPQFKSLSSIKKPESDVGEGAEKKSVPMLSDKKPIQIKIQTKLLALPQETEIKVETKESDSESDSSNDDESDDSDDENTVIDGLPWRTILEDGELTPSSSEEEEKADGDGEEVKGSDEVKGEGEVKSEGQVKGKKDKEEKALDNTGEAKKKSSKHKHKSSKHKKHKHKSKKKKKSKHKHKDKKEKDSTSDSNKDGRISSEKEKDEVKDAGVSASETIDIKGKREKTSSSRRASKDDEQKEGVSEDRKVHRSSSSSRKTSEEREARGSTQERITKEDAKKIKQTEEGKERHRSHSKSRSSSKEKSHTKVVTEDKVTRKEDISEKMTEGKYQSRVNDEERRHKEKSRQGRERHSSEKDSRSERRKESKKSEEDKTCVPSSDKLERGGSKEKHTIVHKEQRNDAESNDQTNSTKPLPEKKMTIETDFKDGSRTIKESVKSTGTKAIDTLSKDTKTIKTEMDGKRDKSHKNDKQTHEERTIKEEKIQKDDTRKESRRKDDRKDGEKEKSRHEESSRREKRHREKGKDKEDRKRHSSKKHQITSKVKIDHLEHDFPSAEEYADDSGDKVQTEMKGDVNSKISDSDKYNSSGIQATLSKPPAVAASPLDDASTEFAGKGKVKIKEDRGSLEDTKTLKGAPSVANVSTCSTNQAKAEKSEVAQEEGASHDDKKIADSVTVAPAKQEEHIGETKDSTTSAKKLEGSSGKSEDDSKLGRDIIGDVESLKASETTETTLVDSESAGRKIVAADKKEDAPSTGNNEKDAVSSTSATVKPVQKVESSEKKVDSKVPEKATEKDSKKRKKEKEEGAIDSEIEEGEITKKHKKSKKKDKKKDRKEDRKEKDKKDRTDRDKSEHRDRDRKSKRRHSEVHSELRSHSRSSQKKHKGSRSKSPSEGDGDSDISIGKTKMVEKSFFSESRGCWVTQMVPKEEDGSSSSGYEDGNEPYDIGDTYIRYPPHDRRSVFDRLGGGSSGARGSSRERFNERYDRRSGYGYRRRRGRSYSRSRSRSRSRSPSFRIDKKKLLEIAKANALQRMRAGDLPANLPIPDSMKKAADTFEVNESIQKFTERCKALANLHGGSSDDDSPVNRPIGSDDEDDETQKTFVRHPFKVKEAAPIVMNIRNAVQIPVVGKEKLRTQFPVSSGSQHRRKEEEIIIANANDPYGQWTTVEKEKPEPAATTATPPTTKASTLQPPPPPSTAPPATTTTPTTPATTATAPATTTTAVAPVVGPVVAGPHIPGVTNVQPPQPVPEKDKVFEDAPEFAYDIGQIVSARLKAARSLQSNPHNVEALTVLHHSQKQIQTWAHSSKKPGLFTGSTDATFLRPEQLSHPNRKNQAWIKKDMFLTAAPVNTDIGRSLMHKMGWKQGEGLGKNSEGAVNPLLLEIKTDRQGLVAAEEKPKKKGDVSKVIRKDLSGKHPVMALNELCNKKRWGKPIFEVVREDGLAHKKNFVFKVRIRNEEYIPTVTSGNKKDAKAMAATVALQKMGLLLSG